MPPFDPFGEQPIPVRKRKPKPLVEADARFNINQNFVIGVDQVRVPFPPMPAPMPAPAWGQVDVDDAIRRIRDQQVLQPVAEPPRKKKINFIPSCEKTTRLPRFKMKYDTEDEWNLRLANSIITVYDKAYYVDRVSGHVECDLTGKMGLGFHGRNSEGGRDWIVFNDEGLNLRSPDPGYIDIQGDAYMYVRHPARVYKQGITSENTGFARAGRKGHINLFGGVGLSTLLKSFEDRPIRQFDISEIMIKATHRLSDRIALVRSGNKISVENRGFVIGYLQGTKVVSEFQSSITERALQAVGLSFGG